ncbi:hypothetical protein HMPREF9946_05298 [Acetobacteraceae bacterium AT-5844]|nr:hypothetical protein HMPREF9946_05298 [Acetobacteraceae bacterium AT-5844]
MEKTGLEREGILRRRNPSLILAKPYEIASTMRRCGRHLAPQRVTGGPSSIPSSVEIGAIAP